MRKKILVCDKYSQDSLSLLSAELDFEVSKSASRQPTVDEIQNTDALLIRSRTTINESLIRRAPRLQLIITATSGFDHIDLDACKKQNITVMHTPEANKEGAAQLTIMHILNWMRRAYMSHKAVVVHMWKEELPLGMELSEKTVGIIGLGRVGKRVASLCKAFNAKVIAHDPYIPEDDFKSLDVTSVGFTEILRESDIISLHIPLTTKTKEMFNRKTFGLMNENALLVNVARGALVNEQDLFEALQKKQIAGAALDVFQKEPLPKDSSLRHLENVMLTPHIGAYTQEALARASMEAVKKAIHYFTANKISDELPPKESWFE